MYNSELASLKLKQVIMHNYRAVVLSFICTFLTASQSAFAFDLPKDLPTFEALMALHKCVKKDEDAALQRVATSFGEQSLVTKGAKKFNEVRTTLDTKLNNAYSYVVLAGAISSTANSLYLLAKEYADFTENTYQTVLKKPFVALLHPLCRCRSLRNQCDEGLDGLETEPRYDAENLH